MCHSRAHAQHSSSKYLIHWSQSHFDVTFDVAIDVTFGVAFGVAFDGTFDEAIS